MSLRADSWTIWFILRRSSKRAAATARQKMRIVQLNAPLFHQMASERDAVLPAAVTVKAAP